MRADRRDSYDEKIQVNIIKNTCKKIAKEFQLNLDLGEFDSISTGYGKNGKYRRRLDFKTVKSILNIAIKRFGRTDKNEFCGELFE